MNHPEVEEVEEVEEGEDKGEEDRRSDAMINESNQLIR